MLIRRLVELAERLDLPPTGYAEAPIHWVIDLNGQGRMISPLRKMETEYTDKKGNTKTKHGVSMLIPYRARSGPAIRPMLMADQGEYALGLIREKNRGSEEKREHAIKCHESFVKLVKECFADTNEPDVGAVASFLNNLDVSKIEFPEDFDPANNLTFRVDGRFPTLSLKVQKFWADFFWDEVLSGSDYRDEEEGVAGENRPGQCQVCGSGCLPVARHPFKIKNIPGCNHPRGASLVSANKPAFQSYGLKASLVAPTCKRCVEKYAKAANVLLERNAPTNYSIDPLMVFTFWTQKGGSFSLLPFLSKPEPELLEELLQSLLKGRQEDDDGFYAAALASSGARVAVRSYSESTVGKVKKNLFRYFLLQTIVTYDGKLGRPLGLYTLASSLCRDGGKDMSISMLKPIFEAAVNGGELPDQILVQALQRCRIEKKVTYPRAALIKMTLLSQKHSSEDDSMKGITKFASLDLENDCPGYLCGRLYGLIEAIQHRAAPNAAKVSQYFTAASICPQNAFPDLVRLAHVYLSKIRSRSHLSYFGYQDDLDDIQRRLMKFPKTFTLEEQGNFMLGYYHQRATIRAEILARMAEKERKAKECQERTDMGNGQPVQQREMDQSLPEKV